MLIPKNAKRVFEWIIFDVYWRKQKLFDWTYSTFEWLKRNPSTVIIPITKDKKIIICKEIQPTYSDYLVHFFGWSCEWDETPIENAKRELLEESWMHSDNFIQIKKDDWWNSKFERFGYFFVAVDTHQIQKPKPDPWEDIEIIEYDLGFFIKNYKKIVTDKNTIWFIDKFILDELKKFL